ncbi:hypothetical protein Taro_021609 [Colocasia esculenta]|uniref:Major facilitator superfamily (MFS) profile domain-containing protein n=1 Tax=Colocasia esculenta TaxID=4460 RepID=A0A843UZA5_COLES|nr:hypothetical protein [Colocasia esculenta]
MALKWLINECLQMHWANNNSIHKRLSSKELMSVVGRNGDGGGGGADCFLNGSRQENTNPSWKLSLPHVCVATVSSFLFGYHLGVVNEPLESISLDLGFGGNTLAEGKRFCRSCGEYMPWWCLCWLYVQWLGCRWNWSSQSFPIECIAYDDWSFYQVIESRPSAMSTSLRGMLLGRFLVGIGMGLGPPVASLYVAEVSPASVRGTYGSFIQIATCLGLMGSLFIGIPVKRIANCTIVKLSRWRVCFWVSTIPAALLAFFMEFCAESPHWLYKRGRVAEAEGEFERLLGGSHVNLAMGELLRSDKGDDAESIRFFELIYGRHSKVVFIGATLFALQQLSGINAIFYFSSAVFKSAGVPSAFANICIGLANLGGSIIAMLLMDKLGRKVLLLGSFFGMAVAMALQATASSFQNYVSWSLYISVFGMLMFVLAFALGAGPVPGLLLPEIFSNRIRAKAMAICMCAHWVIISHPAIIHYSPFLLHVQSQGHSGQGGILHHMFTASVSSK